MDPLPPNWEVATAEDGTTYYYNSETNETSWTVPKPKNKLPPGWEEFTTESGDTYFYNSSTDETTWDRPKNIPPPPSKPKPEPPKSDPPSTSTAAAPSRPTRPTAEVKPLKIGIEPLRIGPQSANQKSSNVEPEPTKEIAVPPKMPTRSTFTTPKSNSLINTPASKIAEEKPKSNSFTSPNKFSSKIVPKEEESQSFYTVTSKKKFGAPKEIEEEKVEEKPKNSFFTIEKKEEKQKFPPKVEKEEEKPKSNNFFTFEKKEEKPKFPPKIEKEEEKPKSNNFFTFEKKEEKPKFPPKSEEKPKQDSKNYFTINIPKISIKKDESISIKPSVPGVPGVKAPPPASKPPTPSSKPPPPPAEKLPPPPNKNIPAPPSDPVPTLPKKNNIISDPVPAPAPSLPKKIVPAPPSDPYPGTTTPAPTLPKKVVPKVEEREEPAREYNTNSNFRPTEMKGYMTKMGHVMPNWKKRYFELQGSSLIYKKAPSDPLVLGTIVLFGAKIEDAAYLNRPCCFAILVQPKNYYLCTDTEKEKNDWMKSLQEAGAADKKVEEEYKKQKEKEDREKRKQQQIKETKEESDYLQNKSDIIQDIQKSKQENEKLSASINHVTCICIIDIPSFETEGKVTKFRLEVKYAHLVWTIFRRYSQFSDMRDQLMRGVAAPRLPALPAKNFSKKENLDPNFIEERRKSLIGFLDGVSKQRSAIFADKYYVYHFAKFMAPVQIGDVRPDNFVMPFKLEPP